MAVAVASEGGCFSCLRTVLDYFRLFLAVLDGFPSSMAVVVWVTSFSGKRRRFKKDGSSVRDVNECSTQLLLDEAKEHSLEVPAAEHVLGLVKLSPCERHGPQTLLIDSERAQLDFWRFRFFDSGGVSYDEFFWCDVLAHQPLPEAVPREQGLRKRFVTLFCELEPGVSARLCNRIPTSQLVEESNRANVLPVALQLPALFAQMIVSGVWRRLCIPSSQATSGKGRPLGLGLGRSFLPPAFMPRDAAPGVSGGTRPSLLDKEYLWRLMCDLQRAMPHLPKPNCEALENHVKSLDALYCDRQRMMIGDSTARFAIEAVVQCVTLCNKLRNSDLVIDAIADVCRLVLPLRDAEEIIDKLRGKGSLRIPGKDKISRSRLVVDIAFQFCLRDLYFNAKVLSRGLATCIMIDSSPQFGRDYELAMMTCIRQEDAFTLMKKMEDVYEREDFPSDIRVQDFEDEQQLVNDMAKMVNVIVLTPTVLGRARCGLSDKLHALLHALRLLVDSLSDLSVLLRSIVGFCTDFGTESSLATVPRIPLSRAFPYEAAPEPVDAFASAGPEDAVPGMCDLTASVEFPGPLHIIHNITTALGDCMVHFKVQADKLTSLAKMLTYQAYKQNLLATCFASGEAFHLRKEIIAFKSKVNPKRFGTVSAAALEIEKVEKAMRFAWNLDKFTKRNNKQPRDDDNPHKLDWNDLDATIHSEFSWAYWLMFRSLGSVLQHLMKWSEGCACHWNLCQQSADDFKTLRMCERCPWRGRRAPDLAAGELLEELKQLGKREGTKLFSSLPKHLPANDKTAIMRDFRKGRDYLMFMLTLKTTHFQRQPWRSFAIGHKDFAVATKALRETLESDHQHPRVAALKTHPLRSQAECWLQTGELDEDHCAFNVYLMQSRMPWTVERKIEGEHARLKRSLKTRIRIQNPMRRSTIGIRVCMMSANEAAIS